LISLASGSGFPGKTAPPACGYIKNKDADTDADEDGGQRIVTGRRFLGY